LTVGGGEMRGLTAASNKKTTTATMPSRRLSLPVIVSGFLPCLLSATGAAGNSINFCNKN
jgi:hypothetical protein